MSKEYFTENISDETIANMIDKALKFEKNKKNEKIPRANIIKAISAAAAVVLVIGAINLLPNMLENPNGSADSGNGTENDVNLAVTTATTETTATNENISDTSVTAAEIETETETEIAPDFEYGKVKNLSIDSLTGNYIIEKSDTDKTTIEVEGIDKFKDIFKADYSAETGDLKISYKKANINNINWGNSENIVRIKIAYDGEKPEELKITANGSASVETSLPFKKLNVAKPNGSVSVNAQTISFDDVRIDTNGSANINFKDAKTLTLDTNGSGNITFNDVDNCNISTNGSCNVKFNYAKESSLSINGSGDINFNEADNCDASINGSGYISGGNINILKASINGSGDMEFEECNELTAEVNAYGNITVGKVNKSISASLTRRGQGVKGEGTITIKSGEVETFYAFIDSINTQNKAVINAKNVTTDKADITIKNRGTVEIGRVTGELTENIGENANLMEYGNEIKRNGGNQPTYTGNNPDGDANVNYNESGLNGIIDLLPYMSENAIDEIARKEYERVGRLDKLSETVLCFMSESLLNELAMNEYETNGLKNISDTMLAYIDDNTIDEIARKEYEKSGLKGLDRIMRAMSDNLIDELALNEYNKNGST